MFHLSGEQTCAGLGKGKVILGPDFKGRQLQDEDQRKPGRMRNFNSHSQLDKRVAYAFLPGERIPTEVCDFQGFAEFDAFRNFWNVWKKYMKEKKRLDKSLSCEKRDTRYQ